MKNLICLRNSISGQPTYVFKNPVLNIDAIDNGKNGLVNLITGQRVNLPDGWSLGDNYIATTEEHGCTFSNSKNVGELLKTVGCTYEFFLQLDQWKTVFPKGYEYKNISLNSIAQTSLEQSACQLNTFIDNQNHNLTFSTWWSGTGQRVSLQTIDLGINHFAITFKNDIVKFYSNGELISTTDIIYDNPNLKIINTIYLCQLHYYTTNGSFVGKIFANRINLDELSADDIKNNYLLDMKRFYISCYML